MRARILKRGQSYNLAVPCEAFNFQQGPHSKLYHAWEHLAPPILQPSRLLGCLTLCLLAPRPVTAANERGRLSGSPNVWDYKAASCRAAEDTIAIIYSLRKEDISP